jgi:hypothetical protein
MVLQPPEEEKNEFNSYEKVWELRQKTYEINHYEGYNVLLGYSFVKRQQWLYRSSDFK